MVCEVTGKEICLSLTSLLGVGKKKRKDFSINTDSQLDGSDIDS